MRHATATESVLSRTRRAEVWLFAALAIAGALWAMDRLTAPPEGADDAVFDTTPRRLDGGRMFVLFVDSLRFDTAQNDEVMPNLAALRARSASAKVNSSIDAVSTPAVRAAFTGRDRLSVFGFVANFKKGRENVPSMLGQLRVAGGRCAVYSDGTFAQFGDDVTDRRDNEEGDEDDDQEVQLRAAKSALKEYLEGEHDLVLMHLTFTDHIAHREGVGGDDYYDAFEAVDALIGELDAAVKPGDSFVVFGDHGHDLDGRHAMGLDIPTEIVLRGPTYAPGAYVGRIAITDYRYLLGFGLGLPLATSYGAGRHPKALRSEQPLPFAYGLSAPSPDHETGAGGGMPAQWHDFFVLKLFYLGLLAAVLWRLLGSLPTSRLRWAALVPLLWTTSLPALLVGIALAGTVALGPARHRRPRALVIGPLLAIAFALWGYLLAVWRPMVHWPELRVLAALWISAGICGWAFIRWKRLGAGLASFAVLAGPALLFYPTAYRYGWAAAMGPALICWAVFSGRYLVFESQRTAAERRWLMALLGLMVVFMAPFIFCEASNFSFDRWRGFAVPTGTTPWFILGGAAKTLVFCLHARKPREWGLGLAAAAALIVVQVQYAPIPPLAVLAAATIALSAAAVLRYRSGRSQTVWTLALFGLWLLYLYGVRVPRETAAWADCLLGAFALASTVVAELDSRAERATSAVFLRVCSIIAAGWLTLAWGFYRLEWGFVYDAFPPALVEAEVAWFIPAILLRYALVLVMITLVIARPLGSLLAQTQALTYRVVSFKLASLAAITLGLGAANSGSSVYLEAVQQTSILLTLMLGLIPLATVLSFAPQPELT